MGSGFHTQLEEAKVHFQDWKLLEAYHIFRRFYDRLPFSPSAEHAEHISIFVQILMELGRDPELSFYRVQVEKLYYAKYDPHLGFALAVLYTYGPEPRMEAARSLFEKILSDPSASEFHFRSQLFLARYYDEVKEDVGACRMIINSLQTPEDPELRYRLDIWKAHLLTMEGRFSEAEQALHTLISHIAPESNWYSHFSAKLALAWHHAVTGRDEDARALLIELKTRLEGRPSKQLQTKLLSVEEKLKGADPLGVLYLEAGPSTVTLTYRKRWVKLRRSSPSGALLMLMLEKQVIDKVIIVRTLWDGAYEGTRRDDQRIRYQVHALRRRLMNLGLPPKVIEFTEGGYRLSTQVERIGEVR